jgi:cytoskeletal protein RodZ
LSIDDIARQTKISPRYLKAIEADNFDVLPGSIFARNFIRQYAASIDLDGTALTADLPSFDLAAAPLPVAPVSYESSSGWDPRWNSALASFVWILLAGGAAVGAYVYFNRPARVAPLAAAIAPQPAQTTAQPKQQLAPVTPAVAENSDSASPATPTPGAPVPATPADASLPDNRPVRVVISAHQDAWIQVSADGKTVFTGTLKPDDTKAFSADDYVRVLSGNAGGIDISLNGKMIDSLGPAGQVRSVRLTAEGPQFPPKSPPVSDPV